MRLKQLELHGYKTFALPTTFIFDHGITAIVGPNGSGKSNIADAIRWALGEQSYRLLRAKQTEDMIFSGSERRPRMGMAEVTLIFDNEDGALPIEFAEVSITRRAYRSGANEYLINGQQARLRDIIELLAKIGLSQRTYAVIGQGLVDAALSLRPQERRTLIEEAAGITLYQARRADALRKLEETQANLLRVHDLINELAPRLQRLQHQAERTEEYYHAKKQLDELLRIWYGYRWGEAQDTLHIARRRAAHRRNRVAEIRSRLDEIAAQINTNRQTQTDLRAQIGDLHNQSSQLHIRAERLQRELAVATERRRLLSQQCEELEAELIPLRTNLQAQDERIAVIEDEIQAIEEQLLAARKTLQEAQAQLDTHQAERNRLLTRQAALQNRAFTLSTQRADAQNRLAQWAERRDELQAQIASYQKAFQEIQQRLDSLVQERTALTQQRTQLEQTLSQLTERLKEQQKLRETILQQQEELHRQLAALQRDLERLQARYELLSRLREEGEDLYQGVRAVLQAAAQHKLDGILGTVANLIRVPAEYETAIETALGAQLQHLVVERWEHAEAAIQWLKNHHAGRATFLPLDTIHPPSPVRPPAIDGLIGLAGDLVQSEPVLRPIVELLLNRTLITRDLPTAHRVLRTLKGSYQIVTPEGELARSSGSVTGGTTQIRKQGILAREREWRELPGQIRKLEKRQADLQAQLQNLQQRERTVQQAIDTILAKQQTHQTTLQELIHQHQTLSQAIDRAQQELEWQQTLIQQTEREQNELREREIEWTQRAEELAQEEATVTAQLEELTSQLQDDQLDALTALVSERRTAVALLEQQHNTQQTILRSHQANRQQLADQIRAKEERINALQNESAELTHQIEQLQTEHTQLTSQIAAIQAQITPAEKQLQTLEEEQAQLEDKEETLRSLYHEAEEHYNRARLEVQRCEETLRSLRHEIEEELGLVELEITEEVDDQPPLPLHPIVSHLPIVRELPENLEEDIRQLRAYMRRLGPINPDAPAEYQELRERYDFLTTQAQDLEKAADDLRRILSELDQIMRDAFHKTFRAVAREFSHYFTRLFNGGTARLVLTDPDDPLNTGIDIIARPPGKRQQGLALLSGGERSLTAAALIFAILRVSPTPFCVLDEVDAALDEANISRFRETLKELAEETQFIIITHNRGTIEAANTIYGISMGEDGASRVLSLKLDGVEIPQDEATPETATG